MKGAKILEFAKLPSSSQGCFSSTTLWRYNKLQDNRGYDGRFL